MKYFIVCGVVFPLGFISGMTNNYLIKKEGIMKKITWIILFLFSNVFTQNIDLDMLVEETQISAEVSNPGDFGLFWWIPNEFWIGSFQEDPSIDKATLDEFINIVSPYTIFVAAHAELNVLGTFTYKPKDEMMKKFKIFDSYNNSYYPLNDYEISTEAKDFIQLMAPYFAQIMGTMGENMQFFLFPSKNKYKSEIVNLKSNGFFKFEYENIKYQYRLPLGALIPQKTCYTCYEKFKGNYLYCPWDGALLK